MKKTQLTFFTKQLKRVTPLQVIALMIVAVLLFSVKKYFHQQTEWRTIKIEVVAQDWTKTFGPASILPPFWLAQKIHQGDVEVGLDGQKIAEVVDVENYPAANESVDSYVTLRVRGLDNLRAHNFVYNNFPIEVGNQIEFHLSGVKVDGQVIDDHVPDQGYPQKDFWVTVRDANIENWQADLIKRGLQMSDGKRVVAEIEDVNIEPPISPIFYGQNFGENQIRPNFSLQQDSKSVDMVLKMKLRATNYFGTWYFAGHQSLKVGNLLSLYFPEVNIEKTRIEKIEAIQ